MTSVWLPGLIVILAGVATAGLLALIESRRPEERCRCTTRQGIGDVGRMRLRRCVSCGTVYAHSLEEMW